MRTEFRLSTSRIVARKLRSGSRIAIDAKALYDEHGCSTEANFTQCEWQDAALLRRQGDMQANAYRGFMHMRANDTVEVQEQHRIVEFCGS